MHHFLSLVIFAVAANGLYVIWRLKRYYTYKEKLKGLASSICDPGTWTIKSRPGMLVLKGSVDGQKIFYTTYGNSSYLLLECSLRCHFTARPAKSLDRVPEPLRGTVQTIFNRPGVQSISASSAAGNFFNKCFGDSIFYGKRGVRLNKWYASLSWPQEFFERDIIKSEIELLVELVRKAAA